MPYGKGTYGKKRGRPSKAAKAKGDEKAIEKHRKIAYDLQNKKKMNLTLEINQVFL